MENRPQMTRIKRIGADQISGHSQHPLDPWSIQVKP